VTGAPHAVARRFTIASMAFALADLVLGCTVFGILSLGILAAFGAGWIGLTQEYAAHAMVFGTLAQARAAAGLLIVCPVFALLVAWLGYRAFQLPRKLWRIAREPPVGLPAVLPSPWPAWTGSTPPVPMAEEALWAVRARRRPDESRYVSLLVGGI
jgi:hypothetical protein